MTKPQTDRDTAGADAAQDIAGPKQVEQALQESENRYRQLFENLAEAFAVHEVVYGEDGKPIDYRFLDLNSAFEQSTGLKRQDVVGRTLLEVLPDSERFWIDKYAEVAATGVPARFERFFPPLGRHYEVHAFSPRRGQFATLFLDITARKQAEQEREITIEFLRIVNEATGTADLIKAATTFFQAQSDCEAVGIRLKDGDDFPYYEARGFPQEFLRLEGQLCARDAAGNILRNGDGDPVIECMCGNVICGRFNPQKPFFTAAGSFWANDTTRLLATTTDTDRQARTRNRCNGEGYESVVLIALRVGSERLGLLQLNDRRRGMFKREVVSLWERLAGYLAVAVAKARADEALRESESKYRAFFEHLRESVSVFQPVRDGQGKVVDWICCDANEVALRLLGRDAAGVRGGSASEILGAQGSSFDHERFCRVLASGEPSVYETVFGNRHYLVSVFRIAEDRVASAALDISERKQAEDALAILARLYSVLSRVNEAIVRTHDQQTLYAEVCRSVAEGGGFPLVWVGLVEGRAVTPVARCGSATNYLDHIRVEVDGELGAGPTGSCIREGRAVINDDFGSNPSTTLWRVPALDCGFRASAAFPLRRQGRVIGALTLYSPNKGAFDPAQIRLLEALCADVSYAIGAMEQERLRSDAEQALRESESSLRDVDRRKNEFLAVLSHELRNPLTPIRNSLHILDRAVPGGDQARRAHNVIDRQVGHLSRLVDDLLDMTRISSNKIRLDRQVLDLNDLVRRSVDDHRSLFEKNGIQVEVTLAPERASVDGDGTRLAQVVGNLLQNAAKFTGRGGHTGVLVAVDPTERHATIRVTDTGVGMAPDVLARLFQPFMQADTSLDRSKGGLGLGLALIKGLVELHGGTIGAHSDGLGKGAQFVVRLPLAPEGVVLAEAGRANVHQAHRRVLIIEDNIDAASSLREVLELGEHQVAVAHNGTDGLAKAREFRPQVVLCDIGLPGMDGYEVARAFRADETLRRTFLVALTGYALPEDSRRATEAGFQRHLAKPLSLQALEDLLAAPESETGLVVGGETDGRS
ncbi:MAG: GAF domain-containing protein [Polyangia bacterium]